MVIDNGRTEAGMMRVGVIKDLLDIYTRIVQLSRLVVKKNRLLAEELKSNVFSYYIVLFAVTQ